MVGNETKRPDSNAAPRREAAVWFERIHAEDVSTEDIGEWQRWLASSPANRDAFGRIEDFWRRAGELEKPPWPTQFEIDVDTYDGTAPVADWGRVPVRKRRTYLWTLAASLAAVAVSVAVYSLVSRSISGSSDLAVFETALGEHREIALPDGTKALLGARSTMSVDFTDEARNVVVDSGEVFFTVVRDRSRPFVVRAGAGTITAVGTSFNVENLQGTVVVTVAEGSVDVLSVRAPAAAPTEQSAESTPAPVPRRVQAGERLAYGKIATDVQPVDTERTLAWREGRLEYMGDPLKLVIPDVARYTDRQLVITDSTVEEILYTGSVMTDDVDDWLTSLSDVFAIEVVRVGDDRVLLQARKPVERNE